MLEMLSNWNLIRTSGFLAYYLLTLAIMAGFMQKLISFQWQKPLLSEIHKISGWTGVLTIIFHSVLLLENHYVPYKIGEILIPFSAHNDPVNSALGTISFYLFLLVMATSDFFTKRMGQRLWKNIHFLVIPAWILMTLHGLFMGTDSGQPWAIFTYSLGAALIITLLGFRYFESRYKMQIKQK